MPSQVAKSGFSAKYGNSLSRSVGAHAKDETSYSRFGNLPGGINNGVAQLIEAKFDTHDSGDHEGDYYFYCAGTVVSPDKAPDGTPIKGLRTSYTELMYDTVNSKGVTVTQDEHVSNMLNEMRKLGGDTSHVTSGEDLENLATALVQAAPHFRFTTSQGKPTPEYPDPRVWENWSGSKGLENYTPSSNDRPVTDNTGGTTEETDDLLILGEAADGGNGPAQATLEERALALNIDSQFIKDASSWSSVADMIRKGGTNSSPETSTPVEEPVGGSVDYVGLGSKADEGDESAIDVLTASAGGQGLDHNQYETWVSLETALSSQEPSSTSSPSVDSDWAPEKGHIYFYKNPQAKEETEHEVTAVFPGAKKVNLKRLNDDKGFKSVPWDKLSSGE